MGMADIKEILVAWDAGEGVSAIERRLGYTRPTVRKYVRAAEAVGLRRGGGRRAEAEWDRLAQAALAAVAGAGKPTPAAAEVARHHEYLERWVGRVPLSVLHQRLRDADLGGLRASWPTLYRYARAHWPERLRPPPRVTIRLDDPPPGEEAQVDFFYIGLWADPEAGRRRRLHGFQMTLSHSRHTFLYPVAAEDGAAWLAGHVEAFAFFGGAPKRVVPDNLSAGVAHPDRYDPRLNRAYGELARHYGVLVDPARVRHPRDKPRVERANGYAQTSCFAGKALDGLRLAELRADARRWCLEVAGRRVHGTTGERPLEAFLARERPALQPLPAAPWERAVWTSAVVHPDCHVRAGGACYSVPYRYVGRRLDVRLGERTVAVFDGPLPVTAHARQARGRATRPEHYPPAGRAYLRGTAEACLARAAAVGPATGQVVVALLTPFALGRLREVHALLRLAEAYPAPRLERACRVALDAGDGRYRTVRGLLERGLEARPPDPDPPPAVAARAYLRGPAAFAAPAAGEAEAAGVAPW
jgi:transposase